MWLCSLLHDLIFNLDAYCLELTPSVVFGTLNMKQSVELYTMLHYFICLFMGCGAVVVDDGLGFYFESNK